MKRSLLSAMAVFICMAILNASGGGGPLSVNTINVTNATCTGINNGSAQVTGVGGISPYSYSWSPSGGNADLATNLAPGVYTVTVTDDISQTATATVTIGQNSPIQITNDGLSDYMGYNISCFGGNNGSINTTVSGGPAALDSINFSYTGNEQLFVVPAGVTSVTIKAWGAQGGANWANNTNFGGYASGDLAVTPGETLYVYVGQKPNGITGGYNGGGNGEGAGQGGGGASDVRQGGNALINRVIVGAGAGGAGYWSALHVSGGIGGGLTGGDGYREPDFATNPGGRGATQTSGGTDGTCVSFNNPAPAGSFGQGGSPSGCGCEGYGGGGGWYGGAGSGNCRGGGGGSSYIDGVTNGYTVGGINTGDGKITIVYNSSTTGYTYAWSNSASTDDITDLTAGTYILNVSTASGCTATDTFNLTQPAQLSATMNVTDISCYGGNDGSIAMIPAGGVAGYSYAWTPSGNTSTITGLAAGNYSVTITDTLGCIYNTSSSLADPDSISLSAIVTNETMGNDGAINLTVTGGNSPYTFAWSNSATTEDLSGIAGGTYDVEVTDSNNCTQNLSVVVGSTLSIAGYSQDGLSIYPNPSDHIFNLVVENITSGNYELMVTDMNGKAVFNKTGNYTGTVITINASEWTSGSYIVKLILDTHTYIRKVIVQ